MVTRVRRYILNNYEKALTRILPRNRFGDNLFATIIHLRAHRRWPGRYPLFSDYLWKMKVGGELYNALRQFVSDKEFVKLYIGAVAGGRYVVPTYAILRSEESLAEFAFPDDCVAKPTHGTGDVLYVRNGREADKKKLMTFFKVSLYSKGRQINYKYLQPKIIVEEKAFGMNKPMDYKLFCFKGEPKFFVLDSKTDDGRWQTFVDTEWRPCNFRISLAAHREPIERPACLEEMIEVARKLAEPFELIRVDFFTDNERFFVGELTNCHASGAARFASRADEEAFSRALFG